MDVSILSNQELCELLSKAKKEFNSRFDVNIHIKAKMLELYTTLSDLEKKKEKLEKELVKVNNKIEITEQEIESYDTFDKHEYGYCESCEMFELCLIGESFYRKCRSCLIENNSKFCCESKFSEECNSDCNKEVDWSS